MFFKKYWMSIIICIVALSWLVKEFCLPPFDYKKATALAKAGKYAEAFELFDDLGDYKDSVQQAEAIRNSHPSELLKLIAKGNIITFGRYEQDNNIPNGPEDIEWIVLERNSDKILVISLFALDCKLELGVSYGCYDWSENELRKWLNGTFLKIAFTPSEQKMIFRTHVHGAKKKKEEGTDDNIFLLSVSEVNKYFFFDSDARCQPTDYSKARGCFIYKKDDNKYCAWWLRSHVEGSTSKFHTVNYEGSICEASLYSDAIGIRPVMWINLNKEETIGL